MKKREIFNANNLYVGKLTYLSSKWTEFGPKVVTTKTNYLFTKLNDNEYEEVFTGYVTTNNEEYSYFDVSYVTDIKPVKEIVSNIIPNVNKMAMLLLLDAVNNPVENEKRSKLDKSKLKLGRYFK